MNTVIGYGSLINPLSFVARHLEIDFDPVYKQDNRLFDQYTLDGVRDCWETFNISYYPVTIKGFKRFYSIEHRNGGMLEVYPHDTASITAALYTNVPDKVYDSVVSTEGKYNVSILDTEQTYSYTEDTELPKNISAKIFTPQKDVPDVSVKRQPVYHDRIIESFAFLIENNLLTEKDTIQFLRDFLKTTYEYNGGEWKTLHEIDGNTDIERLREYMKEGDSWYPYE